jgi:NAD(P)-dependent dehydrogenase (short-subunit alcohol dehydrogenase family)
MSKVVFITGGNRGIGLEFVRYYLAKGFQVVATSRQPYDKSSDLGKLIPMENHLILDTSCQKSIESLANFKRPIDYLINNAGILAVDKLETLTAENMTSQFTTNTLGPLFVSKALLPNLSAGSKSIPFCSKLSCEHYVCDGKCRRE